MPIGIRWNELYVYVNKKLQIILKLDFKRIELFLCLINAGVVREVEGSGLQIHLGKPAT